MQKQQKRGLDHHQSTSGIFRGDELKFEENEPAIELLTNLYKEFFEKLNLKILISVEIEFYILGSKGDNVGNFLAHCCSEISELGILLCPVERETEDEQYEITFAPLMCPSTVAKSVCVVRENFRHNAPKFGYLVDFSAKPFWGKSGNGMHVNISIHNVIGANLFSKSINVAEENDIMYYSMGGLCETMEESMIYFAPTEHSYDRFTKTSLDDHFPYSFAPRNISWGGNNRTVALRIPTSSDNTKSRHIEHRVPGADSNPFLVFSSIISGIFHGIDNRILPKSGKIWGNAFDDQLNLLKLPVSISEARFANKKGEILKKYFKEAGGV